MKGKITREELDQSLVTDLKTINSQLDNMPRQGLDESNIITMKERYTINGINIRDFGAKTGRNNATETTSALKKALVFAGKTGIRKILIPYGEYYVNESLTLEGNTTIQGLNRGLSKLRTININKPLFDLGVNSIFIKIKDLGIYGDGDYRTNESNNLNHGIKAIGSNHLIIDSCDIRNMLGDGIYISQGSNSTTPISIELKNCYIKNNCGRGVYSKATHGLKINGGAIEFNRNWNIELGQESMEISISHINCNIADYDIEGGAIKIDSSAVNLDGIEIDNIHIEDQAGEYSHNYYLVDLKGNNITFKDNYIRARNTTVLGAINVYNFNINLENNKIRHVKTGININNTSSNYVLKMKNNVFESVDTNIKDNKVGRWVDVNNFPYLYTQEIEFDMTSTNVIAIKKPRFKKCLYSSSILLQQKTDSVYYPQSSIIISPNTDGSNPWYTSNANEFTNRSIGTTVSTNLPSIIEENIFYLKVSYLAGSNAKYILILEWV